ncbi:MAG: DUF1566 domain-containing protein [Propionivibrio sp.]|uniref:hypothetical protein n=1 Tax=Propionivibrio sp. TaxID=2212460 RepID=UPI001A57E70D|nr:hypothetical protein [Propionivibrio sp.]MBL8413666.1 DUF1566 domain-containing protein [Propionivibrio sp.]
MKRLNKAALALATAGVLSSGVAQAALNDRGGGLIYDVVLNITWLRDANYAATQYAATGGTQGDADGLMNWNAANAWAAGLSYAGYDDWRLPTALNQDGSGPCDSFDCTNSEMGHMFYNNMGAIAFNSILTGSNTANLAQFTNLQPYIYWSGTATRRIRPTAHGTSVSAMASRSASTKALSFMPGRFAPAMSPPYQNPRRMPC